MKHTAHINLVNNMLRTGPLKISWIYHVDSNTEQVSWTTAGNGLRDTEIEMYYCAALELLMV